MTKREKAHTEANQALLPLLARGDPTREMLPTLPPRRQNAKTTRPPQQHAKTAKHPAGFGRIHCLSPAKSG
jgi:hypothetical protein